MNKIIRIFLRLTLILLILTSEKSYANQATAYDLVNSVIEEYQNEFNIAGRTLEFEFKSTSQHENATYQFGPGNVVRIIIYGGLWFAKEMNASGLMLVACHELGHVRKAILEGGETASEGDADYFAAFECAPRVLQKISSPPSASLPQFVLDACASSTQMKTEICKQVNSGAFALAQLRARIYGQKAIAFETPDPTVVTRTDGNHLSAQCSLDTFFAASLGKPRPACWFHFSE